MMPLYNKMAELEKIGVLTFNRPEVSVSCSTSLNHLHQTRFQRDASTADERFTTTINNQAEYDLRDRYFYDEASIKVVLAQVSQCSFLTCSGVFALSQDATTH